jgi:hypothetical protein
MGRRTRNPADVQQSKDPATCAGVGAGPTLDPDGGGARELPDVYAGPGSESAHKSLEGGQRVDRGALIGALDAALGSVVLSLPLTLGDTVALFDMMRGIAKPPLILDVMHDSKGITARVFDGQQEIFARVLTSA